MDFRVIRSDWARGWWRLSPFFSLSLIESLKNKTMLTETFPAEHHDFYMKFEVWRKKMLKENKPQSGVYILNSNRLIGRLVKVDDSIFSLGVCKLLQIRFSHQNML